MRSRTGRMLLGSAAHETLRSTLPLSPGKWLRLVGIIFEEILTDDGIEAYARTDKLGVYESKFVLGNERYKIVPRERLPWILSGPPAPYTLELLFEGLKQFVKDHNDLGIESTYYDVAAAYALATPRYESFRAFPYIWCVAPPGSGKSTFLETLNEVCYRAAIAGSTTMAGMSRMIHYFHCTMLADEAQVNEDPAQKSEFQAVLNVGYRPTGRRALASGGGERQWTPTFLNVYSPKVMASTHLPWEALGGRCLIFKMAKTQRQDLKPTLTGSFHVEGKRLRSQLLQYRFDHLREEPPERIHSLDEVISEPRLRELGLPLLTVAPPSAHANILGYLKELEQERLSEEQISEDAAYVQALMSLVNEVEPYGKIPTETIRKALMIPLELGPETERFLPAPRTVGMKLRELGFKATSTAGPKRSLRGIILDPVLLKKRAAQYLPQNAQSASENTREKAVEADEALSGGILVEKDICNKCYLSKYRSDRTTTRPPVNGTCEDCGEPAAYRVTVR